ncbi:hypothetical protein MXD61_10965 [Frankia sp. AgPm24]|uniref:hypothetical protein n=1 Tax=Frankia sp. AgPm24 TaxID=631128 RepID=UPI00201090F5|nr:hypothetical protein [Frankia sp. AgPm24]MCK9922391.1 hypothetical protein [Frankia sp. AgPm24]
MVESVGLAVAALLATRATEAFGAGAGRGAWDFVRRLADLVRDRLGSDPGAAAALEELRAGPSDPARIRALAGFVQHYADDDPDFSDQLERLVREGSRDPVAGRFVTEVTGNASIGKLVNIAEVQGDVNF